MEGEIVMIVSRAPVRLSFGGGGTDLEAYYGRFGGFVLSTAINRYCYVAATEPADGGIHIRSAGFPAGEARAARSSLDDGPAGLARAAITLFASTEIARRGVSLTLASDVPPGTGLGSSSAMAVALLHVLARYLSLPLDAVGIADLACQLEIERLGMPIGKQDQYASACGGLNTIEFTSGGVDVRPLVLPDRLRRALQSRLLLFATGQRRNSSAILSKQREDTRRKISTVTHLHQIKALGLAMRDALLTEDLDGFGRLLDRAWHEKRQLSVAISNTSIDSWYFAARTAGALGGKITGAGGGGYLLLYAPPQRVRTVRRAMCECGLREMPFELERAGVRPVKRLPSEYQAALALNEVMGRVRPPRRLALRSVEGGVSHA